MTQHEQWPPEALETLRRALDKPPGRRTVEESRALMYHAKNRTFKPLLQVWNIAPRTQGNETP
jgi:hypothetical protein